MKPPFILPNVAILEPDESNQSYRLIKRRETFEDIFHTHIFLSDVTQPIREINGCSEFKKS
jgi:hypothetical protein